MKKTAKNVLIITIAAFYFSCTCVYGQALTSVKDSLQSQVLNENRKLEIFIPGDYKPGTSQKYDVIYVLDGEWNNSITTQMAPYISKERFMPQNIIVSIPNTYVNGNNMRDRDFTPTRSNQIHNSGGADNFLLFLKNELIPYVNKKYPCSGQNMVFGQSLGGLFAMYSLLKEPSLFQSYLLADPSFWFDNNFVLKLADKKLNDLKGVEAALWIVGRAGRPAIGQGITAMDSLLKLKAPALMHWTVKEEPYETHTSTQVKTLYDGLKFAYRGYVPVSIEVVPVNGLVLAGKPFTVWCGNSFVDNIRYTLDGTEPTLNSANLHDETTLTLQASSKFMVKGLCNRPQYNKEMDGNFVVGSVLPSQSKPKGLHPNALGYEYFEGTWDKLPDLGKITPVRSGYADKHFDISTFSTSTNTAYIFKGYLEIKEDGYYTFLMIGGDEVNLFLGNKLLINSNDKKDPKESTSYLIPLMKGFYSIKLEALRKKGSNSFTLIYSTPSGRGNFMSLPDELVYGK